MKLSVLIPVWNEQTSVEDIVRRVATMDTSALAALGTPVELEIIAVDDHSTDESQSILARLHGGPAECPGEGPRAPRTSTDPREHAEHADGAPSAHTAGETTGQTTGETMERIAGLRVIRHPINRGKGAGIRTGLAAATGDFVIIQDADYEYDPADIPKLLKPVVEGKAQVVYGARPLDGSGGRLIMDWGNRALTIITNLLYGTRLHDMETCYKLLPTELLRSFNLECSRFDMEPEITAKVTRSGHRIHEIPIAYHPRPAGEGGKKLSAQKDGIPALLALLRYRTWQPPVKPSPAIGTSSTPTPAAPRA